MQDVSLGVPHLRIEHSPPVVHLGLLGYPPQLLGSGARTQHSSKFQHRRPRDAVVSDGAALQVPFADELENRPGRRAIKMLRKSRVQEQEKSRVLPDTKRLRVARGERQGQDVIR
jgi:hypothetical protein